MGAIGISKTAEGGHRMHWLMQSEKGRFLFSESAGASITNTKAANVDHGSFLTTTSKTAMAAAVENLYRAEHNVSGKYVATQVEQGGITHINAGWDDSAVLAARLSAEKKKVFVAAKKHDHIPPPPEEATKVACCDGCPWCWCTLGPRSCVYNSCGGGVSGAMLPCSQSWLPLSPAQSSLLGVVSCPSTLAMICFLPSSRPLAVSDSVCLL
jgi:hypothetical protein